MSLRLPTFDQALGLLLLVIGNEFIMYQYLSS